MKFYEQKFEHDCEACQWICHRDECDWWYCPGGTFHGSMIKRYSSEGSAYSSIPVDVYVNCTARGDKLISKWDSHFQKVCERFLGIEYAENISNVDVAKELSLPPVKIHCSVLAEDAIKAAIKDYREKHD